MDLQIIKQLIYNKIIMTKTHLQHNFKPSYNLLITLSLLFIIQVFLDILFHVINLLFSTSKITMI